MAARCGVPPEKIQAILDDHLPLDLETLYAIAHHCGLSLDYLAGLANAPRYLTQEKRTAAEEEFLRGVHEIEREFGPIGLRFVDALLRQLMKEDEIQTQARNLVTI